MPDGADTTRQAGDRAALPLFPFALGVMWALLGMLVIALLASEPAGREPRG